MLDKDLMKKAVERSHEDERFNKLAEKYNKLSNKGAETGCVGCLAMPIGLYYGIFMFGSSFYLAHKGDPTGLIFYKTAKDVVSAPLQLTTDILNNRLSRQLKIANKLDEIVRDNYIRCQVEKEEMENGADIETAKANAEIVMQGDLKERHKNLEKDIQEFEEKEDIYFSYRKFDDTLKSRLERYKEEIEEQTEKTDFSKIVDVLKNDKDGKYYTNFNIEEFHKFVAGQLGQQAEESEVEEDLIEEDTDDLDM